MFSQKLKELRLEANLSQKQIAYELGVSQQSYARWETGKHEPTLNTLKKVSKFFKIPIEELLSDKSLSLERILSSETITYQDKELSDENLQEFKQITNEFIKSIS
ncbi:helix-turn-helix transcriptional regulator [Streptococcus sp. H31]|uniref:helix-turn-helix transcriptional regulator n=1 Tax=Streptococcus huangxiaojuni TaxID=3237239 RepID=UPI0034A383F9